MDALSDVLAVVRLSGAVFLDAAFTAPWAVATRAESPLARHYLPRADHLVLYHLVTQGNCWVRLLHGEGEALRVDAGELLVVPHGDAHCLASALDVAPVDAGPLLMQCLADQQDVYTLRQGGGGAETHMVCGFLGCDAAPCNPLLATLPRLMRVDMRSGPAAAWLQASLQFARNETAAGGAGGATVLAKLSELLFVEAIRLYIDALPPDERGWLAGLRDRFVGRALALLHGRPAHAWTVEVLAREVGLSRSALAQRFVDLIGQPPMQYLAHWRLQLAARGLRGTERSLAAVAQEVGYESEAAFSRAFKREFGLPPATWRRHDRMAVQPVSRAPRTVDRPAVEPSSGDGR